MSRNCDDPRPLAELRLADGHQMAEPVPFRVESPDDLPGKIPRTPAREVPTMGLRRVGSYGGDWHSHAQQGIAIRLPIRLFTPSACRIVKRLPSRSAGDVELWQTPTRSRAIRRRLNQETS
jgi:hypothetical protein